MAMIAYGVMWPTAYITMCHNAEPNACAWCVTDTFASNRTCIPPPSHDETRQCSHPIAWRNGRRHLSRLLLISLARLAGIDGKRSR